MSDLESLLNELGPDPDPALPSVERILSGLYSDRFSGVVELRYELGRVVRMRKKESA
jgi:hypothetical protein